MENYLKIHKILISLFVIFFIIFLISSIYSYRGLYCDLPTMYFNSTSNIISNGNNVCSLLFHPIIESSRLFASLLLQFIYIILYHFLPNNIGFCFSVYTFSYIFMPFLFLSFNFVLARKTKRYDISILALAFFTFFLIPYSSFISREIRLASMFFFLFLQYFVSKKKYNLIDKIIIIFLLIFMFESSEEIIPLSIIFIIFSFLFVKKKTEKNFYISIISVFTCLILYVLFKDYCHMHINSASWINEYGTNFKWFFYLKYFPESIIHSSMWISFAGIICIVIKLITKSHFFHLKDLYWIIPLFVIALYIIYVHTGFVPAPDVEQNLFLFAIIILPLLFLIILLFEYKNIPFSRSFLNNLLIVSCVVGILNYSWQILSSYYCLQYKNKLINAIEDSTKPFTMINFAKNTREYSFSRDQNDIFFRAIILSTDKQIKTLFIPNPEHDNYSHSDNVEYEQTYYDVENNILIIKGIRITIQTKLWDLSDIVKVFNEYSINKELKDSEFLSKLKENNLIYIYY